MTINDQSKRALRIFIFFFKFQFTWFEGLARCASMNMSLVTIDTKTKSDDIAALLKNNFNKHIFLWIGGCVNGTDPRQFVWIATGKEFTFSNWGTNQPDFSHHNEYCAHLDYSTTVTWNDNICQSTLGFMCENKHVQKCEEETKILSRVVGEGDEELNRLRKQLDGRVIFRDLIFNVRQ